MRCKRVLSAVLSAAVLIITSACGETAAVQESEKDLFAMDTFMTLKAYGENGSEALNAAAEKISELEALLSVTSESSEVARINGAAGAQTAVSAETAYLIGRSLEINRETGGAFDITLYPVTREWGFTTGSYKVLTQDELDELLKSVGSENVALDADGGAVSLKKGANIDLGGIAKGYAGSRAAEVIKASGVTSAILNMGGNVQTIGAKPDGSSWKIGIKDPIDNSRLVGTVEVADKAVITSGGYERYFEDENGDIYWHILDPKTGRPAETDIISVTVIGSDGTTCDALSTSLFVMGTEKAAAYLQTAREYDAVIVTRDNKLYVTGGIAGAFKASDSFSAYPLNMI